MLNKEIRLQLLAKLKISKQAISKQAKKIKENYGPMSTDEAVYIIAHQNKIDLSKYLSIGEVDRIRSLVPKSIGIKTSDEPHAKKVKIKGRQQKKENSYPLVLEATIQKAIKIGEETYPLVFVLEASIRNLIIKQLNAKYGTDWWNQANIKNIRENVEKTIVKEEKYPYREKRGKDKLSYTNFEDLKRIIMNEQSAFSSVIVDFQWFDSRMNEIYMARNALAHSTDISKDDHNRIDLFFRDWARLLENGGIK
jgi:hypothetical protein